MSLTIQLLGDIKIFVNGKRVERFPSRASEAVLAYVAMHNRPVAREHLISLLWEYSEPKQAAANLRSALSSLRKALGDHIDVTRYQVTLRTEGVTVDASLFVREMSNVGSLTLSEIETSLNRYQGDFLAEFYIRDGREFEEWALIQRERLQQLAIVGLRKVVKSKLNTADYATGVALAERWLSIDPYSEEAYRQLMWLYIRSGQRSAALRTYQRCATTLLNDIGVPPARTTVALNFRLEQLNFPPLSNMQPNNSDFVGRQAEVAQLCDMLVQHQQRLTTLLGIGGMGKTRLATAVGHQIIETQPGAFLDGVFMVELASVEQPSQVAFAVAAALGVELGGGNSAENNLFQLIAQQEILLILDNLEQLLSDETLPQLLNNLIQNCPDVYILATSRERLNLYEEAVHDLSGLPLPPAKLDATETYPSIDLFIQAAQRVQQGFSADFAARSAIAEIARLVDGVPLALELAASQVHQMPVAKIAGSLADILPDVESKLHNLPLRQRSLRAVFNHSWELLTAEQQQHFAALSIFPDSFSADTALAICNISLHQLFDLQDKSLVAVLQNGRHRLHPLLRQFSAEKRDHTQNKQDPIAAAHALHFLRWITSIEREFSQEEQTRLLPAELANVRLAWSYFSAHQSIAELAALLTPLFEYFLRTNQYGDCFQTFQLTLEQLTATDKPTNILRGRLLNAQGRALIQSGAVTEAGAKFEQAIGILEHYDEPLHLALAFAQLAMTKIRSGKFTQAATLVEHSLLLAQQHEEGGLIALCHNLFGSIHKARGEFSLSETHFQQSLAVRRQLSDPIGVAMVLNNLGNLALERTDYEKALSNFEQAREIFEQASYAPGKAAALANSALAAQKIGRLDQVRELVQRSLEMRRAIPDLRGVCLALIQLSEIELSLGDVTAAQAALREAIQSTLAIDDRSLESKTLCAIASWYHAEQRWDAETWLLTYLRQLDGLEFDTKQQIEALWHVRERTESVADYFDFSADFPHLSAMLS